MSHTAPAEPPTAYTYHRMPYSTEDGWGWDLQGDEHRYLGDIDLAGKRVLEIGCATGGLTFWMVHQGADVTAIDLGPDIDATPWDVFVRVGDDNIDDMRHTMHVIGSNMNAHWRYARDYFGVDATLVNATAYTVPESLGTFDVVTLGSVLLHVRDPLRAMEHAVSFTHDTLVVTELMPRLLNDDELGRPLAYLLPEPDIRSRHGGITWWHLSPSLVRHYFETKGFTVVSLTEGTFRHRSGPKQLFTVVARLPV